MYNIIYILMDIMCILTVFDGALVMGETKEEKLNIFPIIVIVSTTLCPARYKMELVFICFKFDRNKITHYWKTIPKLGLLTNDKGLFANLFDFKLGRICVYFCFSSIYDEFEK